VSRELVHEWRRGSYRIRKSDRDLMPAEVDGIVLQADGEICLGMHVGMTHDVDVTHIPSGKRVGHFRTLGAAMEFVHRIAYLTDWTLPDPVLKDHTIVAITEIHRTLLLSERTPHDVP
jgi:hypothetical protein